jgi:hypothetical protein
MIKWLTRKHTAVPEGMFYLINNEYLITVTVLGTGIRLLFE